METIKEDIRTIEIKGNTLQVSNLGRVFRDGNELKQNENFDGYLVVYVGNNRSVGVHRLVAMAFISNDNPEVKNEVNHKDFDRKNNIYTNLEWLSHSDNVRFSHKSGRYKPRFGEDNPNYGNTKLSKIYAKNPDLALEKQSRKGAVNGKAIPIELYKDEVLIKKFDYIGDCCQYLHEHHGFSSDYEIVRCGIRRSINKNRPYRGFTFVK